MPGTSGSSLYFDNSFGYCCSATNQNRTYISVPASSSLRPSKVTVAAWIKPRQRTVSNNYVISKCRSISIGSQTLPCGNTDYGLYIGNSLVFRVLLKQGTASAEYFEIDVDGSIIKLNEWQHIAGVYNGSGLYLYYNGNQVANLTDNAVKNKYIITTNDPLRIGSETDVTNQYMIYDRSFSGAIDEVSVYNRGLSADEIKDLYKSSIIDCDDRDKTIYPNAPELCGDGIDQNCNMEIDDKCEEVCGGIGYVRCAWNTGFWDTKYNQPERCRAYIDSSSTWVDEGPNCDTLNKKCYAVTIKPQSGFTYGEGKIGCVGKSFIDNDGRTMFNEYGSVTFPASLNISDLKRQGGLYADCVSIYNGYLKIDNGACPQLIPPIDIELIVYPDAFGNNYKLMYDANNDNIFEGQLNPVSDSGFDEDWARTLYFVSNYVGKFVVSTSTNSAPLIQGNSIKDITGAATTVGPDQCAVGKDKDGACLTANNCVPPKKCPISGGGTSSIRNCKKCDIEDAVTRQCGTPPPPTRGVVMMSGSSVDDDETCEDVTDEKCPGDNNVDQNGYCCTDPTGSGKCPCCDENGRPMGILSLWPNCPPRLNTRIWMGCASDAVPSAPPCGNAGYSNHGSRPC